MTIEVQVLKNLAKYFLLHDNAVAMMVEDRDFSEEVRKAFVQGFEKIRRR